MRLVAPSTDQQGGSSIAAFKSFSLFDIAAPHLSSVEPGVKIHIQSVRVTVTCAVPFTLMFMRKVGGAAVFRAPIYSHAVPIHGSASSLIKSAASKPYGTWHQSCLEHRSAVIDGPPSTGKTAVDDVVVAIVFDVSCESIHASVGSSAFGNVQVSGIASIASSSTPSATHTLAKTKARANAKFSAARKKAAGMFGTEKKASGALPARSTSQLTKTQLKQATSLFRAQQKSAAGMFGVDTPPKSTGKFKPRVRRSAGMFGTDVRKSASASFGKRNTSKTSKLAMPRARANGKLAACSL